MRLLNNNDTKLTIFDTRSGIEIDKNLPKYNVKSTSKENGTSYVYAVDDTTLSNLTSDIKSSNDVYEYILKNVLNLNNLSIDEFNVNLDVLKKSGIWEDTALLELIGENNGPVKEVKSFFDKLKYLFKRENKGPVIDKNFNILKFFENVKNLKNLEETNLYCKRIEEIAITYIYAKRAGQVSLCEQILNELVLAKYESVLFAKDMKKCVSSDNLVKFAKGCPKGLALDYIKNYTRVIPIDVMKKKIEADNLKIFDNYVIMHYDPQEKSYKETVEERAKKTEEKRDPILFGVIRGSDKLYFIADWIDEYCDLTFEKITSQLSKEIIENDFIKEYKRKI